jgi:hypothetical protein
MMIFFAGMQNDDVGRGNVSKGVKLTADGGTKLSLADGNAIVIRIETAPTR